MSYLEGQKFSHQFLCLLIQLRHPRVFDFPQALNLFQGIQLLIAN